MLTLNQQQFKALVTAIRGSFDQNELASLMLLECKQVLADLVALPMEWGPLCTQVVRRAQMQQFEEELVLAVATWRPRNVVLNKLLRELTQAPGAEITLALNREALGVHANGADALQGIVRGASNWASYDDFLGGLAAIGPRICRIEAASDGDAVYGTGFLVGDDLVLTNSHVRDALLKEGQAAACRFDYRQLAGSQAVRAGLVVEAANEAWVAWSPYAQSDVLEGGTLPTAAELDYALLRIADPVGRFEPGHEAETQPQSARGHFVLKPDAGALALGADVIVVQHPGGRPLKIALGQAKAVLSEWRCAHDAPTEGGTSGSPCFDLKLQLRALHHGTDPKDPRRPRFNQAVPIGAVAADLAAKGKLP